MDKLLFGTAGVPLCTKKQETISGIIEVYKLKLDCMELEFVNGVKMGSTTANLVRKKKEEVGISLSVHAPYYINLNSKDEQKKQASIYRIIQSVEIGKKCGADRVTFHPAFYSGDNPKTCFKNVVSSFETILKSVGNDIKIAPETAGKVSSFGSLEELLALCREFPDLSICLDFAHLYARTCGDINSFGRFVSILEKVEKNIPGYLNDIYVHVSGIEYGLKGETRHLSFADSHFNWKDLLQAFEYLKVKGLVICESPNLENDALMIQEYYRGVTCKDLGLKYSGSHPKKSCAF